MTEPATEFLRDWTCANLPSECAPSLRVSKATKLAKECRDEAAKQGISNEELTLAAYGNLVAYFQDELARSMLGTWSKPDVMRP